MPHQVTAESENASLRELKKRMRSLHHNCLTNLAAGLGSVTDGDVTVDAHPVTTPLNARPAEWIGELGELFNTMLGKAQARIAGYNAMRERLQQRVGGMVGEIGTLAGRVAAPSQEMTAGAQQTGTAIDRIAKATTTVAEAVEKQVAPAACDAGGDGRGGREGRRRARSPKRVSR